MLVEAYYSISKIKRYHSPLQQAYKIISEEFRGINISNEMKLQIVIKTVNDLIGPDSIIPTLLVFRAYLRITNNSLLSPTTIKRTKTIRKTSNKVRKFYAKRHVDNILRIKNSFNITEILQLPI
jgi:hypothetical protein